MLECWSIGILGNCVFAIISVLHHANRSLMIPMTQESDEAPLAQELRLISGVRTKVSGAASTLHVDEGWRPGRCFHRGRERRGFDQGFADSPSIRDKFLSPG